MSVISIRLNDDEEKILKKYTESKGMTISQYIKNILFDEIEDEFDLEVCKDYLERKEKNQVNMIAFDEAVKDWGI